MAAKFLPSLSVFLVGAGVLLLCAVMAALLWHQGVFNRHGATSPAPEPVENPVLPEVQATPTASDIPSMPLAVAGTDSKMITSLDELRRLCPDPWTEDVPDACIAALGSRYRQEGMRTVRPHHDGGGWEPSAGPLSAEVSWEEAFANPEDARRAVEEALAKPECGRFIVRDTMERFGIADDRDNAASAHLRKTCAAGEAAKLAMLEAGCVKLLRVGGRLERSSDSHPDDQAAMALLRERDTSHRHETYWTWHVERLDGNTTLTPDEYWARRDEIEDGRFRFAWRRLMCRAVPPETFALLDGLPEPGHDIHQGDHLRRYAGRLGNEWALAVAERNEEEIWGPVD